MYDAKVPEMWRKVGGGTSDKLANLIGYRKIAFISTHTKIGTPHEKAPVTVQTEVNLLNPLFRSSYFWPVFISD